MAADKFGRMAIVAASVAGFVGGALSSFVLNSGVASAARMGGAARVVRAQRFVVVDSRGMRRAEIGTDNVTGGGVVRLFDREGRTRIVLGIAGGHASIALYDEKGKVRVASSAGGGNDYVQMYDSNGVIRVGLGVQGDSSALAFSGANGLLRSVLGVTGDQANGLTIYDKNGKTREVIGLTGEQPLMQIQDAGGKVLWQQPK